MTLVCDAGALVALERNDRAMWCRVKGELDGRQPPVTHGGVLAQVWRGGKGRQALLARALSGMEVADLGRDLGLQAGVLLGRAQASDAIDAAVVLLAHDGDLIVTSDPADIQHLVAATGLRVDVVPA